MIDILVSRLRQWADDLSAGRKCIGADQDIREAANLLAECTPYLKPMETPAHRIYREFLDCQSLIKLLAKRTEERDQARSSLRMWNEAFATGRHEPMVIAYETSIATMEKTDDKG